jgi:branched-subunit amino acid aminotransferase/4-amino-4-deoxychorismate lyase
VASKQADYIWMNGEIVPWAEAKIHVATDAVLRGENVFEGIRAYWNEPEAESYIFKNPDHLRRLRQSAKVMRMRIPYSDEELSQAFVDLLRKNSFTSTVHLRPARSSTWATTGAPTSLTPKPVSSSWRSRARTVRRSSPASRAASAPGGATPTSRRRRGSRPAPTTTTRAWR